MTEKGISDKKEEKKEGLPRVFINSRGREVRIQAIQLSTLERIRIRARKDMEEAGFSFERPTYQVKTAGGDVPMVYPVTAESVEAKGDEEETARRRDALAAYNANVNALMALAGSRNLQYIFAEGVEDGPDEEWLAKCQHYGIDVPEDRLDRKFFFIMEEVCPAPDDLADLQAAILDLATEGRIRKEDVEAAKSFFRRATRGGEGREGESADLPAGDLRIAQKWAVGGFDAVLGMARDEGVGDQDRGGVGGTEP